MSGRADGERSVGAAKGFGEQAGEALSSGFVVEHGAGSEVAALVGGQAVSIQGDLNSDGFVGGFHFRIDGGGWVWETGGLCVNLLG